MQKTTFFQSTQPVCLFRLQSHTPLRLEDILHTRRNGFYLLHDFHFTANFRDYTLKMVSTTGSALICNTPQVDYGSIQGTNRYTSLFIRSPDYVARTCICYPICRILYIMRISLLGHLVYPCFFQGYYVLIHVTLLHNSIHDTCYYNITLVYYAEILIQI